MSSTEHLPERLTLRGASLVRGSGYVFAGPRLVARALRRGRDWLNTAIWRLAVAEIGRGTVIEWGVTIASPRDARFGRNCRIMAGSRLHTEAPGAPIILADGVQINENVSLDYTGGVTLERGSLISPGTMILTHSHGHDPHSAPVGIGLVIGEGAWIGARAMIMASTRSIGNGAVVAAGAIVTKPVEENTIVGGNPARVLRVRSEPDSGPG